MSSAPKVKSIKELRKIEKELTIAYYEGGFDEAVDKFKDSTKFIYDIPMEFCKYVTRETYKECLKEGSSKVSLEIRMGYWRKFNALHSWLVKNVQKDVDDCGDYIVEERHLKILDMELKRINKENVKEIMPTAEGFFFGGTEYDEYFWREVEDLKAFVTYALTQISRERMLIYHSSW
ncbi:MAG TPA: hypothetical protein VNX68_02850 [Nitrosopumilaceae archaeon]|nr:hypothetical protein [Nitrosopumilaceae archaeon]